MVGSLYFTNELLSRKVPARAAMALSPETRCPVGALPSLPAARLDCNRPATVYGSPWSRRPIGSVGRASADGAGDAGGGSRISGVRR